MTTPLSKIRKSGFGLALVGSSIEIKPASALTHEQRQFLKANKPEIIRELKIERIKQAGDEKKVLSWLSYIGETDQEIIEDTLRRCREDRETMEYFLNRAEEITRTGRQSK